ncbi:prolactin-2C5 [Phodopus roborovskii]|uniref:prolactin-2C5 n=1 Tax=Phodopus roborovskii TaxID=109678 RepID=UPI0021E483B0|nr:prolactin-2C5 [Phodopus roborovskii]
MQLSLTQPRSWTLLLLLSNLLLWDNVASVTMCAMKNGHCFLSLKKMFHMAGKQSREASEIISGIFTDFKKHYVEVHRLQKTVPNKCHTSSIPLPKNKEQAWKAGKNDLLKSVDILLTSWNTPLQHLEDLFTLKDVPAVVISKVKTMKEKDAGLVEGIKTLYNLLGNGETVNYPAWTGKASLKSDNEDARILAFYDMISCLNSDFKKIKIYLNILKWKIYRLKNY